jgi:hypothetical protein
MGVHVALGCSVYWHFEALRDSRHRGLPSHKRLLTDLLNGFQHRSTAILESSFHIARTGQRKRPASSGNTRRRSRTSGGSVTQKKPPFGGECKGRLTLWQTRRATLNPGGKFSRYRRGNRKRARIPRRHVSPKSARTSAHFVASASRISPIGPVSGFQVLQGQNSRFFEKGSAIDVSGPAGKHCRRCGHDRSGRPARSS